MVSSTMVVIFWSSVMVIYPSTIVVISLSITVVNWKYYSSQLSTGLLTILAKSIANNDTNTLHWKYCRYQCRYFFKKYWRYFYIDTFTDTFEQNWDVTAWKRLAVKAFLIAIQRISILNRLLPSQLNKKTIDHGRLNHFSYRYFLSFSTVSTLSGYTLLSQSRSYCMRSSCVWNLKPHLRSTRTCVKFSEGGWRLLAASWLAASAEVKAF